MHLKGITQPSCAQALDRICSLTSCRVTSFKRYYMYNAIDAGHNSDVRAERRVIGRAQALVSGLTSL